MLNTLKIHDANHYKWVANGSDKANSANAHIKIVKYIFSNFSEKYWPVFILLKYFLFCRCIPQKIKKKKNLNVQLVSTALF